MKRLLLITFLLFFIGGTMALPDRVIDARSGVEIIFVTESGMFPTNWYGGTIKGSAVSLDESERQRSVDILKKAMVKYPVDVLKKTLKKIYVLKDLNFFGVGYGGTNTDYKVYVVNEGLSNGYDDNFVEKLFHAEYSSVLFNMFPDYFNAKAWQKMNPDGWKYTGTTGAEAIRDGESSESITDKYNSQGFLNQYSQSTLENDFNAFAKNIFCCDETFWNTVEKYRGLVVKLYLAVDFYHKINPAFTEDYFRKLSK
jgi:hypothetical protein